MHNHNRNETLTKHNARFLLTPNLIVDCLIISGTARKYIEKPVYLSFLKHSVVKQRRQLLKSIFAKSFEKGGL
jgi:hypothetical protein